MSTRQPEQEPISEIEIDIPDRTGPVLTDAQYAEALQHIGGVSLELRRLSWAIGWERPEPARHPLRLTLH
jgi:hypothetical protein